jgi:hemoglobin
MTNATTANTSGNTYLYDSIGAAPAVGAAVDGLYARLMADPETARFFTGVDIARVNGHMRLFLTSALRGAPNRTGRDLGAVHAHLGVTDADFDRVAGHLVAVLAGLGLDETLVADVLGLIAPLRAVIVADAGHVTGPPAAS